MLKTIMSMKMLRLTAVAAAAAFLFLVALRPAKAATPVTGQFNVTATITASCTIGTISNLAFGTYDPSAAIGSGNGQSSTSLSVTCTSGTPYTVSLNYGTGTGATNADRYMSGTGAAAGSQIAYNLYTDAGYTTVWYDAADCASEATVNANCGTNTGNGSAQSMNIYGEISGTQTPSLPAGTYSDTITATVTY